MKWLNLLICIFFSSFTNASIEVACSHEEICKLVRKLDQNIKTKVLVNIKGDPHEFEPSADEIKNFLNAPILIIGPIELNPWIKKINYQRSKNPTLKTYSFQLSTELANYYQSNNKEALSHFWLYPRIFCDFTQQLIKFEIFSHLKTKIKCEIVQIEKNLEAKFKNINSPIVLTHDALYPLLKKYTNEDVQIINLKGSNHHEEISPLAIKNVYKLKAKKIIWILEKNISVPLAISNLIKNEDKKILIDTAKSNSELDFSILLTLLGEMN